MGKVGGFFDIVNIFCLASRLVDWQNPICAYDDEDALSIETNDPSQALKERLETMPDNLGIEIPVGPIGKTEAERIMSTAISAMKSQATIGPDAMSQDELNEFMARLRAPNPTTMLTVAASVPTKRSEATSASDHSSEEELKKTADEGPERAGFFCLPFVLICL
ncbi:hypothetical protein KCU92_g8770, partial [Aureobasidium melanogenum]